MIHYHGVPITPDVAGLSILSRRHAMVSFAHAEQLPLVASVCHSFALDNGAFSAWKTGAPVTSWEPFYAWVHDWRRHPGFDFALIPDVIDGDEDANDELISDCPFNDIEMSPVWHLHESLDRLDRLATSWSRVSLGSSGEFTEVKTDRWWYRMAEAMEVLCVDGKPRVRLHGLRMLDPEVFTQFPLASADSTNVARNIGLDLRWKGTYAPPSKAVRGAVLIDRIESHQSSATWKIRDSQRTLPLFAPVSAPAA